MLAVRLPRLFEAWRQPPGPPETAQGWFERFAADVRILEVGNVHLHMATAHEVKRLQRAEEEFFNGLTFPVERYALPVPLDLSEHIQELQSMAQGDPRRARGSMLLGQAQHLASLIQQRCLVFWRNLLVIPVDEQSRVDRVQFVRAGMERMNLPCRELTKADVALLWQELVNPVGAAADPIRPDDPLDGVIDRIVPIEGLSFAEHSSFRMGAKLCRVLVVVDYPRYASPRLLGELYRVDRRAIVIQHIRPTDRLKLQKEISNSIGELTARRSRPSSAMEREQVQARLMDAQRLLRRITRSKHSVVDLSTYLLLRCDSLEELERLTEDITVSLGGKGLTVVQAPFWLAENALGTCLPVVQEDDRLATELGARRNIPAGSMPATFPYQNAELTHGRGFLFGLNQDTGNPVLLDPWELLNPHSIFLGGSGSGKTFTLNLGTIRFWAQGIKILSLDVEGDKGRLCSALGGQRVRIAPRAGNYINPMEVRRPPLDPTLFLDADAEEPANGLAATIQRQLVLFSLLDPKISAQELARAEALMIQCYNRHGITFDTDYSRVPSRAWPTWTHLYDYLQQDPKTENLAGVLHSWVHGSLSGIFDGHTNVNLDNQYVVLDIHDVTRHSLALAPVQFACMAYLWDEINRDWRERKVVDLDELGIFADHQAALAFAWMVVKCARRRRCRVQIATQDPADFLAGGSKYAQGILTNCATKVLGYLEPTALAQIAGALRLSEAEQDLILRLQVWEKLIVCGEQQAHVEVVASLPELRILDPEGYERATGRPA